MSKLYGDKIMPCFNLTQPPKVDKFRFNAARCKKAIEKLSDLVYDASDPEMGDAMDDLVTDIEDLHRRAQERDQILAALDDLAHGSEYIYPDDLYVIYDCHTNENADLELTEDLVL